MLFQKENFFTNLDYILPELYKIKLYTKDEFNKKFDKQQWPGLRSEPLTDYHPILTSYILDNLKKIPIFSNTKFRLSMYLHLRLPEDDPKDWIHKDEGEDFAGLIYLNKTNLSSGTLIYDDEKNIINDMKYVKNRFICYNGSYNHKGYGYFGDSVKNGRLTLNLFMKKVK
tara:strand:+ start:677 stop:1186 length:510 start_codon:yes stop_codon:yes gene_type:complete